MSRALILLLMMTWRAAGQDATLAKEVFVWKPLKNGPRYVLPRINGRTPEQTVRQWKALMAANPTYSGMENAKHLAELSTDASTISQLPDSTPDHPNVVVILNRPNQMTTRSTYLPTVVQSFEREGPRLFAVPVGLETLLSPPEMQRWQDQLNRFDGQLGVGGDDPHPSMYRQADTSKTLGDISHERDLHQSAYIRSYLNGGKGRVFYICGSMQRAAILDGHGFHCDVAHLTDTPQRGPDGPVMLEVVVEPESELALAARSERFRTSNYHHAAINPAQPLRPESPPASRITSYNVNADGTRGLIPKSIEFPGNAGFATQFHPEFRGSPEEHNIVGYVSEGWKMRGRHTPDAVVDCVLRKLQQMGASQF